LGQIKFVYSFFACTNLDVDFHFRHSLSAGGPGASSAHLAPVGSPLDSLFPQESRTLRSNQLCLKIWIELLLPTFFFVLKRKQIWLNVGS